MAISKNEFALKNIQEKLQYLFENGGESGGGRVWFNAADC